MIDGAALCRQIENVAATSVLAVAIVFLAVAIAYWERVLHKLGG